MFQESIQIRGDVSIKKWTNGELVHEDEIKNLVVTNGKNYISAKLANDNSEGTAITHMGIGTNNTVPVVGNTALGIPLTPRQALSSTAHTVGNNYSEFTAAFNGATYAPSTTVYVSEAGLFTDIASGIMICRTTFGAFPLTSSDIVAITWRLTVV